MADYANDVLVDTQWVEDHLSDDSIRIVEVDENPALYAEAHIPGAIGFDWKKDLQDQVKRDFLGAGGLRQALRQPRDLERPHRRPLRRPQQLVRRLHVLVPEVLRPQQREAGERPAREVDRRGPADHLRRALATRRRSSPPGGRRRDPRPPRRGPGARSTPSTAWWTSARPQEFSGELIAMAGYEQEGAQRAGHIPGAASVPWAQAVPGGRHLQVGRRPPRALHLARA